MPTKTLSGEEAREAILKGMQAVALPVISSMGAQGRNTAFPGPMGVEVTNDGVTIARLVDPVDPFEKIGADMIKQAGEQTNREAGDGTSSSIDFAYELSVAGVEDTEHSGMELRRILNEEKVKLVATLKEMAVPCETREQLMEVARISVEDEAIAEIVVDSVMKAGKYGTVIVDDGVGYVIEKQEEQGYWWDKGFVSPYMINNERGEAVLENPVVIVTDRHLNLNSELVQLLGELHGAGETSVLLISDNVEGELLQTLILNKIKGRMTVVAVKRPPTLDELEDIALLTDSVTATRDKGIKEITKAYTGRAERVIVSKSKTTLIGKKGVRLDGRIQEIAEAIKDDKDNDDLKRRMGMLAGGIVRLRVGAKTETERSYLRRKVDDAVLATIAAQEEGIVAGGGTTLAKLAEGTDCAVLKKALSMPRYHILKNAELPTDDGFDYNVRTGKKVKNHMKEGIVDPAKVVRCEIENGISLAGAFLTVENVVAVIPESQVIQPQQQ